MTPNYTPLNSSRSEIRLLAIEQGAEADELRCFLSVASLDTQPSYEALSYVWGDASDTVAVIVDGSLHPVTRSLSFALRALRKPSTPRIIWADALCINQQDIQEKEFQIPLMGRIYSEASEVVACLGEGNPELDYFARWAGVHYSNRPKFLSFRWSKKQIFSYLSPAGYVNRHVSNARFAKGEFMFFGQSYFHRMWTVQEFALAKNPPVFLIGQQSMRIERSRKAPMKGFVTAGVAYMRTKRHNHIFSPELRQEFEDELQDIHEGAGMNYNSLINNRIMDTSKILEFPESLWYTTHRQCFDSRDRVYALYSMAPALQRAHPADYRKPPEQVLWETVSFILRNNPLDFNILSVWPLRSTRLETSDTYPSWVPDIHGHFPPGYWAEKLTVRRSLAQTAPVSLSADSRFLSLQCRELGTCTPILSFSSDPMANLNIIFALITTSTNLASQPVDWRSQLRHKPDIPQRIAYASYYHDFVQPRKMAEGAYKTIQQDYLLGQLDDIPWDEGLPFDFKLVREKLSRLAHKTLFISDSGLFGICSDALAQGDTLTFSPGLHYQPMIVQHRNEYRDHDGHAFSRLVDWAFVDGINGESQNEEVLKWAESQQQRTFRIG